MKFPFHAEFQAALAARMFYGKSCGPTPVSKNVGNAYPVMFESNLSRMYVFALLQFCIGEKNGYCLVRVSDVPLLLGGMLSTWVPSSLLKRRLQGCSLRSGLVAPQI